MSAINIEITNNVYDVDLQQNVTSYEVTLEKGYYPLPGGGGGDISNLVPYDNAIKDVNIGAYFYKTSKGFELAKDLDNRFKVSYNGDYNTLEFSSKDNSDNNFGSINVISNAEEGLFIKKENDSGYNTFQVTTDSTYSHKKFVTDEGFQIIGGTADQYLTANGGTSTLPTDLIRGTGTTNYIPKFSASGTLNNSIISDGGYRIVVSGGALFNTNSDIVIRSTSGDNPGDFVFQNTSGQEQGRVYSATDALIFSAGINPSPKMVIRPNGIGINLPLLNPTEWLEVGGYAKATGFKTPTGTATQALRADGGVFDLNTKADLVGGKVPSSQLPSYVDDVLEFANLASFPATGESGKIYIAIDTNLTYRWGGSSYVVMSSSLALGETASTAYRGDRGKIAYDHSQTTGNPHGTTAEQVGASPIGHTHSGEIITPNAVTIAGSYTDVQAETLAIGTIFYNSDQQCYMQKLSADVYHNFGSELPSLSKIGDNTNHLNGMPVYISSGAGNLKIVSLANSTIGKADAMATQDVANSGNKTGYYCYFGGVNKFPRANVIKSTDDPATWIEGAELRLCSETGKLSTQIEPAPAKCPVVARITAVNGSNISVHFTPNKSFAVEDASNIDGDATSIADTDEILKKEVGGLWKKITFANFKSWFTTELAKKINIGLDTVFNFKNISAMTLTEFRSITPNLETIYFTEEQNGTGWQSLRNDNNIVANTGETLITFVDGESNGDSQFSLIDLTNAKINGVFEKDFVIIKLSSGVVTPATSNQWFKVILKINGVQTAVSPAFYLTEASGTIEQIAYDFSLNVTPEMIANGATLHVKTSATMTFNNPTITVVRVHKSTSATL